jgi:hemoglobin
VQAPPLPPKLSAPPFELLGGEAPVRALAERFYDAMERLEPALAALHERDAEGRVARGARDRFALFLVGWLGGPQTYTEQHGHPRLRMRHARVPVDARMRDAWTRSMSAALDESAITGELRVFLEGRFAEVADFLRNQP